LLAPHYDKPLLNTRAICGIHCSLGEGTHSSIVLTLLLWRIRTMRILQNLATSITQEWVKLHMHWFSYYLESRQVLIHIQTAEIGIRAGQWRLRIQGLSGLLAQGFCLEDPSTLSLWWEGQVCPSPKFIWPHSSIDQYTSLSFLDASLSIKSLLGDTLSSSWLHSQEWETKRKEVDEWKFCQLSRECLHFSVLQYIVLGRTIISKSKLKSEVRILWHL
jgi:hypothetical protein